ncbi:MAG: Rrf2 family transcriptional regulator [Hyphomicrobiaceae bacterium]
MKLNKATSHALRILTACARSEAELQKVAELAETLELTQQNTFKIVHLLSRAGFVEGERGRYGGVRLKLSADLIRVGDVVRAMELAPDRDAAAGAAESGHMQLFDAAFEAFVSVLNQTTIAEMARAQASQSGAEKKAKKRASSKITKTRPKIARTTKPRSGVRTPTTP